MIPAKPYQPKNKIRIVTAASLFDGHDAAINIMRRIMQRSGAEIIHLGHNRSVDEIVNTAIQEDVQGIAITSYQGGHNEYFRYMYDLLKERGCSHIKIFGGGGGTILPSEIAELHDYGITRLYAPDDGIIVYARAQGRRSEEIIEEGTMVRERQELLSIPKRGGMMAEISLHESVLKKVAEGQECRVVVDALPGVTLKGQVEFVALLPDKGSWWANPNLRLFPTRVSIEGDEQNVASGMSCSVEIIVAELEDVVYMPLQSAFVRDDKTVCFIDGVAVEVELGLSNEKWVEVVSGVNAGDIVALSPPDDFLKSGYNSEQE